MSISLLDPALEEDMISIKVLVEHKAVRSSAAEGDPCLSFQTLSPLETSLERGFGAKIAGTSALRHVESKRP